MLSFLTEQARARRRGAYSTFNMGAGFAVYCAAGSGARVVSIAQGLGSEAIRGGARRGRAHGG